MAEITMDSMFRVSNDRPRLSKTRDTIELAMARMAIGMFATHINNQTA